MKTTRVYDCQVETDTNVAAASAACWPRTRPLYYHTLLHPTTPVFRGYTGRTELAAPNSFATKCPNVRPHARPVVEANRFDPAELLKLGPMAFGCHEL